MEKLWLDIAMLLVHNYHECCECSLMGHMRQDLSHAQVMVHQKTYVKKKALTMNM
jgi:hypothetical protein